MSEKTPTKSIKMYEISLQDEWWCAVMSGKKIVEGRIFRDHHSTVKESDFFKINNMKTGSQLTGTITNVTRYDSFEEMLIHEGLKNVLPGVKSVVEGVNVYHKIPGYRSLEGKYGVAAIELRVDQVHWST